MFMINGLCGKIKVKYFPFSLSTFGKKAKCNRVQQTKNVIKIFISCVTSKFVTSCSWKINGSAQITKA